MSIRVTTTYHHISPPTQLTSKLSEISTAGALAKSLGENKLYNDLKNVYNNLKNQWESSVDEECKKKTKKNWLGGGDIYTYFPCQEWDTSVNLSLLVVKNYSSQERLLYLKQSISKLNK